MVIVGVATGTATACRVAKAAARRRISVCQTLGAPREEEWTGTAGIENRLCGIGLPRAGSAARNKEGEPQFAFVVAGSPLPRPPTSGPAASEFTSHRDINHTGRSMSPW